MDAIRRSSIVCLPVATTSEEAANCLTHGAALLLSFVAWLQLLGMTGHGTAGQQLALPCMAVR